MTNANGWCIMLTANAYRTEWKSQTQLPKLANKGEKGKAACSFRGIQLTLSRPLKWGGSTDAKDIT